MNQLRLLLPVILLASAPALSTTTSWHSIAAASSIQWTARWQGTPVKGQFKHFSVTGHVDADHPAGGTLKLTVDTASVSAASPDVTRALHSAEWFGIADFPAAQFTGTLEGTPKSLTLQGTLQLKGHSKKLALPLTLTHDNGHLQLQGNFTLERNDFDIGSGQWRSGSMIATTVHVRFSIRLASGTSG
ncbi:MAG: YceI family protein [Gammaproteobacteria bacterium]